MSDHTLVPIDRLREIAGDFLDILWIEYGAEDDEAMTPKAVDLANCIRAMKADFPDLFETKEAFDGKPHVSIFDRMGD